MRKRNIVLLAAAVVLAVVAISLLRRPARPRIPQLKFLPAEGVAYALAQEASSTFRGDAILLLSLDQTQSASFNQQVSAFRRYLHGGAAKAKIIVVNLAKSDVGPGYPVLPADLAARVLNAHPDAHLVVSLIGPPAAGTLAQLSRERPAPVVLAANGSPDSAGPVLAEGLVRAIVVPRSRVLVDRPLGTPREAFDAYYQLLRGESIGPGSH